MMTGAICGIRPGIPPAVAERELRGLARDTWVTVTPLDGIVRRPIDSLGLLFLGFIGAAILGTLGVLFVRSGAMQAAFLLAKSLVLLTIVFLAGIEFGGAASMTRIGGTTVASATALFWMFAAGCISLRWAWTDQRKRCPNCLSRLALPVRISEGSRMLLEPSGTEMACPRGHGTLFSGHGASMAPDYRWSPLDATRRDLFEPVAK